MLHKTVCFQFISQHNLLERALAHSTNQQSFVACLHVSHWFSAINWSCLSYTLRERAHSAHMLGFDRKSRSFIYLFHIKIYISEKICTLFKWAHILFFFSVRWPQAHASTRLPLDPNVIYLHYSDLSYFKHLFIWSLTYVYFILFFRLNLLVCILHLQMQCDAMRCNAQ